MPTTLRLRAEAVDNDNRIVQIEFFAGSNSLGIIRQMPFELTLSNVVLSEGLHEFYAKVTDRLGSPFQTKISPLVFLTGSCRPQPQVGISGGAAAGTVGRAFGPTNEVKLDCFIDTIDNNLNPVEFFIGTRLIGTASVTAPSLTLTNLPIGRYVFSAKVKDLQGREYSGSSPPVFVTRLSVEGVELATNGQLSFLITGAVPGAPVFIEASTNLNRWQQFDTVTPNSGEVKYRGQLAAQDSERFFRVRIGSAPQPR